MIEHQRSLERHGVSDAVDVYDSLRDVYLGRLVNIHGKGLMLMGDQPMEEDKLYQLDLHLPRPINHHQTIHLGVDCLWTRAAGYNGKHWAGFTIIDLAPSAAADIEGLIDILRRPDDA